VIEYTALLALEKAVREALELHDQLSEPCSSYEALKAALANVEAACEPLRRQNEYATQRGLAGSGR